MRHRTLDEVVARVTALAEGVVIDDRTAATIASWWVSPAPADRAFSLLAQGSDLDSAALDDLASVDARAMADDCDDPEGNYRDRDALRTWARHRKRSALTPRGDKRTCPADHPGSNEPAGPEMGDCVYSEARDTSVEAHTDVDAQATFRPD